LIYSYHNLKEANVFWKQRKNTITISVELHEKIKRSCDLLNQVQSEVVTVRRSKRLQTKGRPATNMYSRHFIFGA